MNGKMPDEYSSLENIKATVAEFLEANFPEAASVIYSGANGPVDVRADSPWKFDENIGTT